MAIDNPNNVTAPAESGGSDNDNSNAKIAGGGGFMKAILLIALIGTAAAGTFLYFDKGSVLARTNQLDQDITALKTQVANFKDQKVEVSRNAQDTLGKIKENEIRWSEVIGEVNKLLPADSGGKRAVNVISYSGSEMGRIALNMVTEPAGVPSFDAVSGLISSFNNSVFFRDAYVPSISKGQTETGESTLSFVLNLTYQKPETGTAELNFGKKPAVNSTKVPVAVKSDTPKVPTK